MRISHLLILGLCLTCTSVFSQKQWYTAFGEDPTELADSLYVNLQTTNIVDKLDAINTLAEAHFLHGSTDSVLYYANYLQDQVLRYTTDLTNSEDYLAQSYLLLGYGRLMNGLKEEALRAFVEGLELNNAVRLDELKLGLAIVYKEKKQFDKSFDLLKDCLKSETLSTRLRAKKQIGDIMVATNDLDNADRVYEEVMHELSVNQSKLYLEIKLQQGKIALKRENYSKALALTKEVTNMTLKHKYYDIYIESVIQTGKIYSVLEDFKAAQMILSIAHVNTVGWDRLGLERDVIQALIRSYVATEDYKNAYALMTQYVSVSTQIKDKQNHQNVRDLEMKYETTVKENEILSLKEKQLKQENNLNRQKTIKNAILIGFLILLIPVIALLVLYYQKLQVQSAFTVQQEELNKSEVAAILKDQELKLIKASIFAQNEERGRIAMELHDSIGGNLAAIKLQLTNTDQKDQQQLLSQIDDTYKQVREISHNLTPTKLVENAFTNVINEYISKLENNVIEEIRFVPFPKDKVDKIEESIKIALFKIIQELLTNTIKYANATSVEIHLNVFKQNIQLLYEDDGDGFDMNNYTKGIGLQNIKKRLQVFNAELNIDSALQRGTAVTVEIPI